jgi:hypothetical protein
MLSKLSQQQTVDGKNVIRTIALQTFLITNVQLSFESRLEANQFRSSKQKKTILFEMRIHSHFGSFDFKIN